MKQVQLIVILIIISTISVVSQDNDVAQYFDDKGLSKVKYLLKAGYDPINGEMSGNAELRLGKFIGIEFGLGLVSLGSQNKLYDDPLPEIASTGVGTDFRSEFRVYPYWGFYEKAYISMMGRLNIFNGKPFYDIVWGFGYQRPIKGRLTYDISAGFGVRMFKETVTIIETYEENDSRFAFSLLLKLGYAF
ncbi:MAG: hypothetical protein ABFS35_10855 [Bacteroidota bacterium]